MTSLRNVSGLLKAPQQTPGRFRIKSETLVHVSFTSDPYLKRGDQAGSEAKLGVFTGRSL